MFTSWLNRIACRTKRTSVNRGQHILIQNFSPSNDIQCIFIAQLARPITVNSSYIYCNLRMLHSLLWKWDQGQTVVRNNYLINVPEGSSEEIIRFNKMCNEGISSKYLNVLIRQAVKPCVNLKSLLLNHFIRVVHLTVSL